MQNTHRTIVVAAALLAGIAMVSSYTATGTQAQGAVPRFKFDPEWPKQLPNKWKMGGVTGLAVDRNDNVWVLNRPNDLTDIELHAEPTPPRAICCVRPPAMIHLDKNGNVIGSFDTAQGHGMDVDSAGFLYIGQDTVRKYDPSGKEVGAIARVSENQGGGGGGRGQQPRIPGRGGAGPVAGFVTPPGGRGAPDPAVVEKQRAAQLAFRQKYPPSTPMIVGGLEEIRMMENDGEIYVADNYLGGRVLVFDMKTLAFKRGWGAYGKPLAEISIDDATRAYTPGGAMAKDFVGHLTLNVSNDGLVYAADRVGNRIHVTDKNGKFVQEIKVAETTAVGGAPGGVGFSPDREQRWLYISDLTNNKIWFIDRKSGKIAGDMGWMGENGGLWYGLHMIAVDSRGNIYTGEVFAGERVQRFVPSDSPRGKLLEQLAKMPN
jgi:DNA-binding beta-propeller fold protein YncE